MQQEREYTLNEVAEMLEMKLLTVRNWVNSGKIVAKKHTPHGIFYVTQTELDRLLDEFNF